MQTNRSKRLHASPITSHPTDRSGEAPLLAKHVVQPEGVLQRTPWIQLLLLLGTLATTTWAGAAYQGISLWRDPGQWAAGLPYALSVLLILGVHEMGHYLVARYHGMRASLPYFLPLPIAIGTLGAFIRMEEGDGDRRKMFDVAVAGPLAGLVASLGILAAGLTLGSTPGAAPAVDPASSVLLGVLAHAVGWDVATLVSQPLVFAGWLGLLLTAFNLLPVGQLDGGHMARALFGERAAIWIGRITLAGTVLLGVLVWHGFLLWALVAFAVSGGSSASRGAAEAAPEERGLLLDARRHAVGVAALGLLALILMPLSGFAASPLSGACPWL